MIRIEHLEKRFRKKQVLYDINLELGDGRYGLIGPNGAGKTTLLRCLAGVLEADRGQISRPQQAGYLPQAFGLFPQLTVYEAMELFAVYKDIPAALRHKEIMDCLEKVNLSDRAGDRAKTLSGGMVRRVGIAQAIMGSPELVILDEPTAGLDPEERARFRTLLEEAEIPTVIVSTHILSDVDSFCDHIIMMREGRIVKTGSAKDYHLGEGTLEKKYLSQLHGQASQ